MSDKNKLKIGFQRGATHHNDGTLIYPDGREIIWPNGGDKEIDNNPANGGYTVGSDRFYLARRDTGLTAINLCDGYSHIFNIEAIKEALREGKEGKHERVDDYADFPPFAELSTFEKVYSFIVPPYWLDRAMANVVKIRENIILGQWESNALSVMHNCAAGLDVKIPAFQLHPVTSPTFYDGPKSLRPF